jgi:hypothetical protein
MTPPAATATTRAAIPADFPIIFGRRFMFSAPPPDRLGIPRSETFIDDEGPYFFDALAQGVRRAFDLSE